MLGMPRCLSACAGMCAQVGVHLSKDLMAIAGHSLKANITTLGPLVLPFSEQLLFLANMFQRKVGAWPFHATLRCPC